MSAAVDKVMEVFAPDGRIYLSEDAFAAVDSLGQAAVDLRGADSVVVYTQERVFDRLVFPESVSRIDSISDGIDSVIDGNPGDAQVTVM